MRRKPSAWCALALVTATAAAVAGLTTPASAASVNQDIQLTTTTLPALRAGETAWVSTLWEGANFTAHNFRMIATSDGATIEYPANTATYSSLYESSDLLSKATDFAALKVTIDDDATGVVTVHLHVTYDLDHNNGTDPQPTAETRDVDVTIPVESYTGPAITVLTDSLGPVARGDSAWVEFSVRGESAGITSLRAMATGPEGISVSYPGAATSSGVNAGTGLGIGETDFFGFSIEAGNVAPGTHDLSVTMTYGNGAEQSVIVPLVVT
jgi:hypothetical protein